MRCVAHSWSWTQVFSDQGGWTAEHERGVAVAYDQEHRLQGHGEVRCSSALTLYVTSTPLWTSKQLSGGFCVADRLILQPLRQLRVKLQNRPFSTCEEYAQHTLVGAL